MLQRGLREIDTPEVSSDFDSRVRAGLTPQGPTWRSIWSFMRPALAPAGLSLAVTLAALIVAGTPKLEGATRLQGATPPNIASGHRTDRLRSAEIDLEQLDNATPSLRGLGRVHRLEKEQPTPATPIRRHGASGRIDATGNSTIQAALNLNGSAART